MNIVLLSLRLILTGLLYAFLGVAFYILWHGLQQNARCGPINPPAALLTITTGDKVGNYILLHAITALGRGEDNTLIVNDPFASTHHAMVLWRGEHWWLEDLESHNGTLLNDARVTQPTPLTTGDLICIGETVFRFELAKPPKDTVLHI